LLIGNYSESERNAQKHTNVRAPLAFPSFKETVILSSVGSCRQLVYETFNFKLHLHTYV